jgi:Transcriptional regulators containing a DNA-binding HTH domain and an aminotransferase domain (MocR family) and their eukaryotic orthologs
MARTRVADALTPHLALQREGGDAMHRQLYSSFRSAILDGVFAPGTRLPSTRALADDLGVSRTTVLQAFERLVSEGYATARSGAGTRVATSLNTSAHRRSTMRVEGRAPRAPERAPRLSRAATEMIEEFNVSRQTHRMVPFALGYPALDEFPVALWARINGVSGERARPRCSASRMAAGIRRCARRSRNTRRPRVVCGVRRSR